MLGVSGNPFLAHSGQCPVVVWFIGSSQPFRPSLLSCKHYCLFGAGLQVFFYKYSKASVCRKPCCVFLPMWCWLLIMCLLVCSAVAIHGLLPIALWQGVQLLAYPSGIILA